MAQDNNLLDLSKYDEELNNMFEHEIQEILKYSKKDDNSFDDNKMLDRAVTTYWKADKINTTCTV